MKVKDYIEQLKKYDQDMPILLSEWNSEDIKSVANQECPSCGEDMDTELSLEQCEDIMSVIDSKHDACIGINWDVIEYHVGEYLNEGDVAYDDESRYCAECKLYSKFHGDGDLTQEEEVAQYKKENPNWKEEKT